jgi:DNA-binding NarL/FixJ family response regulator
VHAGDALLSPSVTRRLIEKFAEGSDAGQGQDEQDSLPAADRTEGQTAASRAGLPAASGTGSPTALSPLTAREREVLAMLGRGLSNTELAEQLFLSPATVKTHVARIFSKLGLRGRAQAVVLAYELGLVRPRVDE